MNLPTERTMSENATHTWVEIDLSPDDSTEVCLDCRGRRLFVEDEPCPGQPFGFTWDDVDVLHAVAEFWRPQDGDGESWNRFRTEQQALRGLAARIAALLPPREP